MTAESPSAIYENEVLRVLSAREQVSTVGGTKHGHFFFQKRAPFQENERCGTSGILKTRCSSTSSLKQPANVEVLHVTWK